MDYTGKILFKENGSNKAKLFLGYMEWTSRWVMGEKGTFYVYCGFYSGWDKGFIWYFLGLTLILISFNFFEISSQRWCTFNFHQSKNIFNRQMLFLSKLLFFLIKTLQYKMIQKANSLSISNHRHNKRTIY